MNATDKLVNKIWGPFLDNTDMVDPFREQNPKRKVWSFNDTGRAKNSRIDRIYVNTVNTNNVTNIQYIRTPFTGHKILTFTLDNGTEKGKGYFKMNTSILLDPKFKEIVQETTTHVRRLRKEDDRETWEIFCMSVKIDLKGRF